MSLVHSGESVHHYPYGKLNGKQKVVTVLNWLGTTAYQLHDEFDYTGRQRQVVRRS